MNAAVRGRRCAGPIRLSLSSRLGDEIDGAWWLRTSSMAGELPELIGALYRQLGEITTISVNWTLSDSVPDFNSQTWKGHRPHVMTVTGAAGRANLLVVPHMTSTSLAVMVLRQAAARPIHAREHDTTAFRVADGILHAARSASAMCAVREPETVPRLGS